MSEVTRSVQRIYTNAKLKVELDKWRSGELVTAETAALEDKLEAENKALREALALIESEAVQRQDPQWCEDVAQAALKQE